MLFFIRHPDPQYVLWVSNEFLRTELVKIVHTLRFGKFNIL